MFTKLFQFQKQLTHLIVTGVCGIETKADPSGSVFFLQNFYQTRIEKFFSGFLFEFEERSFVCEHAVHLVLLARGQNEH
jgi:hypothetical protein